MKKIDQNEVNFQKYEQEKSWGLHAIIDLYQCNKSLLKSPESIENFTVKICEVIDMKRYGAPMIERFAEGYYEGYSLMQFIETSSITAHFDEQEDRAFIDIFSCKYFNPKKALEFSQEFFQAQGSEMEVYFRK